MQHPTHHRNLPTLRRKFAKDSIKPYTSKKKDIRSLTLDDFRPPIALKPEFSKTKKPRQLPLTSMKRRPKILSDLFVSGKYANLINKYIPMMRNSIAIDTDELTFYQNTYYIN